MIVIASFEKKSFVANSDSVFSCLGSQSQVNKRTSCPDSTCDKPGLLTLVTSQDKEDVSSRQRTGEDVSSRQRTGGDEPFRSPVNLQSTPRDHSNSNGADHSRWVGGEELHDALLNLPDGGLCAVCRTGGKLLSCSKCSKQFHPPCHIPALRNFPGWVVRQNLDLQTITILFFFFNAEAADLSFQWLLVVFVLPWFLWDGLRKHTRSRKQKAGVRFWRISSWGQESQ